MFGQNQCMSAEVNGATLIFIHAGNSHQYCLYPLKTNQADQKAFVSGTRNDGSR